MRYISLWIFSVAWRCSFINCILDVLKWPLFISYYSWIFSVLSLSLYYNHSFLPPKYLLFPIINLFLFPVSPCFGKCFCNQISLVKIFSCTFHYFVLFWAGFSVHFLYLNVVNASGWVIFGSETIYSLNYSLLASGQSQAYKHLVWPQPSEQNKKCLYSLPLKSSFIFSFYAILKKTSGKLLK